MSKWQSLMLVTLTFSCALLALQAPVYATTLVYTGKNPDITPTANPQNETAIQAEAALTRPAAPEPASASQGSSEASLVKSNVLNSLSQTILSQLTGTSTSSGTVSFGDGSYATYTTGLVNGVNTRTITFYNLDGTSTTISFPIT